MTRALALAARTMGRRHAALALELVVLALLLVDFARIVARLIGLDSPLHWDEAVYALRARSWVDADLPLSGWSYIRPPLLPLLAAVPVLGGGDEWQLRSIGLIAGIAILLAAWWLGRMVAGPIAGVVAAAVLHGSPTLQKESATLLTDVPAAALLLLAAGLLWHQLEERPRPGAGLVLAAAAGGLAFFMRYGSLLALAPLLAVATVLWWRRLLRADRSIVVAAASVAAVAVVGHVAWSMVQTGAPLGILIDAQNVVSADPRGVAPVSEFIIYLPFRLAGSVGAGAMALGVAGLPLAAIATGLSLAWRRTLRAGLFLVLPALAHIVLLTRGVAHAEERFFLFSAALLVIAGAAVAANLLRALPTAGRIGLVLLVAVALVLARGPAVEHSLRRTSETARYYERFEAAAQAIAAVAGPNCGIVGGGDPIVAWYSGCETDRLRLPGDGGAPGQNLQATERWVVLFGDPDEIDRDAPIPAAVLAHADGEALVIEHPETGKEIAAAWRLRGP